MAKDQSFSLEYQKRWESGEYDLKLDEAKQEEQRLVEMERNRLREIDVQNRRNVQDYVDCPLSEDISLGEFWDLNDSSERACWAEEDVVRLQWNIDDSSMMSLGRHRMPGEGVEFQTYYKGRWEDFRRWKESLNQAPWPDAQFAGVH